PPAGSTRAGRRTAGPRTRARWQEAWTWLSPWRSGGADLSNRWIRGRWNAPKVACGAGSGPARRRAGSPRVRSVQALRAEPGDAGHVDHAAGVGRNDEHAGLHGAADAGVGEDEVALAQHRCGLVEVPAGADVLRRVRGLVVPQREAVGVGQGAEVARVVGHA